MNFAPKAIPQTSHSGIRVDAVRIANFRSLQNIEVGLGDITLLMGMNNSGKTSFLKALHLALGADRRTIFEGPIVIKGKRTIHVMGVVGKTRAAIAYAWKHADDHLALLFISVDTPEALHHNLAALCGPLRPPRPEPPRAERKGASPPSRSRPLLAYAPHHSLAASIRLELSEIQLEIKNGHLLQDPNIIQ